MNVFFFVIFTWASNYCCWINSVDQKPAFSQLFYDSSNGILLMWSFLKIFWCHNFGAEFLVRTFHNIFFFVCRQPNFSLSPLSLKLFGPSELMDVDIKLAAKKSKAVMVANVLKDRTSLFFSYPLVFFLILGYAGWRWVTPGDARWHQVTPGGAGWRWMMPGDADDAGWLQVMPGDAGWHRVTPGDAGWQRVTPDDAGWRVVTPDDVGWRWVMSGDTGWRRVTRVTLGDAGWRWVLPGIDGDARWRRVRPVDAGWQQVT